MPLITTGLDGEQHDSFQKQFQYDAWKIKPGIFFFLKKSTLIASPDWYDKLSLIYKCTPTLNPIKMRSSDSVAPSSVTECLINSIQGISGLAITCFLRAAMHCTDLIWLRRTIMSVLVPHTCYFPHHLWSCNGAAQRKAPQRFRASAIRLTAHGWWGYD